MSLIEEKNRLPGTAAYDLRTPLGVILTYSDLLEHEARSVFSEEHRDFVATILFKPFVKTSVLATEGEPSTRLGLATLHRLVTAHGSETGAVSAEGKGSTFWFTLRGVAI